jgi:hypothetical protein
MLRKVEEEKEVTGRGKEEWMKLYREMYQNETFSSTGAKPAG